MGYQLSKSEMIINKVESESKEICMTDRVRDMIENFENANEYIEKITKLDSELEILNAKNLSDEDMFTEYKRIRKEKDKLMFDYLAQYESQKQFSKFEIFESLENIEKLNAEERRMLANVDNRKNGTSVYLSVEYSEIVKRDILCLTFSKHDINAFDDEYENMFCIEYDYIYLPNVRYLEDLMKNALEKYGKGEL